MLGNRVNLLLVKNANVHQLGLVPNRDIAHCHAEARLQKVGTTRQSPKAAPH